MNEQKFDNNEKINQLIVIASKPIYALLIPLGLFFVPVGVWFIVNSFRDTYRKSHWIIGVLMILIYAVIFGVVFNGYRKSVKYFNNVGLKRNDGKEFLWTELSRVVNQIKRKRSGGFAIWRTEIQFKDGSVAWLIPSKVRNNSEVWNFVNNLPCEHTEKRV